MNTVAHADRKFVGMTDHSAVNLSLRHITLHRIVWHCITLRGRLHRIISNHGEHVIPCYTWTETRLAGPTSFVLANVGTLSFARRSVGETDCKCWRLTVAVANHSIFFVILILRYLNEPSSNELTRNCSSEQRIKSTNYSRPHNAVTCI